MIKKKFPYILLTSTTSIGNYFGAYADASIELKKGYVLFLSTSPNNKDYCECMGYIHGKNCYHLKEARLLSKKLMLGLTNPVLEKTNKKRVVNEK